VVRRGMFVAGLGATQFAMPAAVDMLRSLRSEPDTPESLFLAATDPANLYGTVLPWPRKDGDAAFAERASVLVSTNSEQNSQDAPAQDLAISGNSVPPRSMSRISGAGVILINGNLSAFLRRRSQEIQVFLPESEPSRSRFARELAKKLAEIAIRRQGRKTGLLIATVNGEPAREHFLARFLEESGFVNSAIGFQMRRIAPIPMPAQDAASVEADDDADGDEGEVPETA
jgi:ATP-dependent Lhr-like helicase